MYNNKIVQQTLIKYWHTTHITIWINGIYGMLGKDVGF